jgi:subtilisin-like proprotein convertase family protein
MRREIKMFRIKHNESARKVIYSFVCLGIVAFALWFGAMLNTSSASSDKKSNVAPAATFSGMNTGAIPDRGANNCGQPFGPARDVTFSVTGLSGTPTAVSVDANLTHTWVGDVNATLIAPNGNSQVIFERTGATSATSCGDTSNLGGVYNFTDSATGINWWQLAANTGDVTIPSGNFRTTAAGPQATTNNSPTTNLTAAFSGVSNSNGTWILRLTDGGGGDTGSISAANLTISTDPIISTRKKNDFDGDGKADYVVLRNPSALTSASKVKMNNDTTAKRGERFKNTFSQNLGTNQGSSLTWFVNNSGNNSATIQGFGQSAENDFYVPADYDGDGRADIAIWRGVGDVGPNAGFFYVLNSSNSTITQIDFGILGDNPTVAGDYDGDGKADPAVYRCNPDGPFGPCTWFFKASANNPNGNITYVPWGNNTDEDFFPNPGDFDGDGKYDFCVQRARPGAADQGQFILLRSTDMSFEFIDWGEFSNVVPGDYDGDGKNDFMVVTTDSNNNLIWSLLTRTGNTSFVQWGLAQPPSGQFSEFIAQSDYDGDGKMDVAVFRRDNNNPDNCYYYVRKSSDGTLQTFEWGSTTDIPVNGWDVN